MIKHFLHASFLLILLGATGFSAELTPMIGIGVNSNNNLDQTRSNALTGLTTGIKAGIGYSEYVSSDLFYNMEYLYQRSNYSQKDYGSQSDNYFNLFGEYTFNPGLSIEGWAGYEAFSDQIYNKNNYNMFSFKPAGNYYFSPQTKAELSGDLTYSGFPVNNDYQTYKTIGAAVNHNVNDLINGTVGGLVIGSDGSIASSNYTGYEIETQLHLMPNNKNNFLLKYKIQTLGYIKNFNNRKDNKSFLGIDYIYDIADSLRLFTGVARIDNRSTIRDYDYSNTIAYASIEWSWSLGNVYNTSDSYEKFLYNAALQNIQAKKYEEAKKQLQKVLFWSDSFVDAHFELGYILNATQHYKESSVELEKVITLNPDYLGAYYLLGYDYIQIGDKEKARDILTRLYEIYKDDSVKTALMELNN